MKIGASFTHDGQRYECVGFEDYENKHGHISEMIVLRSRCATCGTPFRLWTTPGGLKRRDVNRRCDEHKRPGVPVHPKASTAKPAKKKPVKRKTTKLAKRGAVRRPRAIFPPAATFAALPPSARRRLPPWRSPRRRLPRNKRPNGAPLFRCWIKPMVYIVDPQEQNGGIRQRLEKLGDDMFAGPNQLKNQVERARMAGEDRKQRELGLAQDAYRSGDLKEFGVHLIGSGSDADVGRYALQRQSLDSKYDDPRLTTLAVAAGLPFANTAIGTREAAGRPPAANVPNLDVAPSVRPSAPGVAAVGLAPAMTPQARVVREMAARRRSSVLGAPLNPTGDTPLPTSGL